MEARDERINQALEGLVESLVPQYQGEDDDVADQRYYQALETAQLSLDEAPHPSVAQNEGHVADLIRRRLIQDTDNPNRALQFSSLYDRLLSQPVLDRKWAHLYLAYLISPAAESRQPANPHLSRLSIGAKDTDPRRSRSPATARASSARVYDNAFAREGLPAAQSPQERRERPIRPPPTSRRKDKSPMMTNGDAPGVMVDKTSWQRDLEPSEASLLRDLPFILQGVSTANFHFTSDITVRLPQTLPGPLIALLHTLAEPGLLYKGLAKFQESSDGGLVAQSLRAAISSDLRSYLGLVASLEGQIRRAVSTLGDAPSRRGLGRAGVTLKRCVVWTRDATMGLRLMSVIVEEAKSRRGGQIISLIHSFATSHGDPFVSIFAERLLTHVTQPFYGMLRQWIYDGELSDPYLEFFVSENKSPADQDENGRPGASSVWEDKYRLATDMIPSIMTPDFAQKVFLIGKSLNFIRHGCRDSTWVDSHSRTSTRELIYGDTATLETSIDSAYKTTMTRLLWLMNTKFKLHEHLSALKSYLLLGAGDFVALLLESLSQNLDKPANTQFRHTLTAQLEHAIRNSNAQFDSPDVLARLDARMLNHSHGDIGWDVFTLEYRVDAPVDVVVTAASNREYLKIFNFLWRVKRVEHALSTTWRRCMTGARGVLRDVDPTLAKEWKDARCVLAEMEHFVLQLQYYILFEVIEASWSQLQSALARDDCTLDDVIEAHERYLKSITRKGLLGRGHMEFTTQLHGLLKVMLAYKEAVEGLYSYSLAEGAKKSERAARIESRTKAGTWGITDRDEDDLASITSRDRNGPRSRDAESPMPAPLLSGTGEMLGHGQGGQGLDNASILSSLRTRLTELSTDFRAKLSGFLGDLAYQPDTDLRFLGVVMNWNEVYKITRRSRRKEGQASGGAGAGVGASSVGKLETVAAGGTAAVGLDSGLEGKGKDGRR